ncbi:putative cytochrome c oxidase subunit va [Diplodia seriata]|uniref:Cytochrome c oxidase subunit 6, mitochondrial n=1 Tax=Diplodia seriata TaxID=420778 RepID=A0A0G2F192_9PEZI|nr:putative cytochrome c oxidase subunit va [Diplodia seriata]
MSSSIFRIAARASRPTFVRTAAPVSAVRFPKSFSTTVRRSSDDHHEESFEEFTARYEKEFDGVQDVFELQHHDNQRNLNNAFAYDLVPSTSVITAALKAARRVNDFPTAVRIFEGIKAKVENKGQYDEYLKELEPLREELGVSLKESLYPESQ